MQLNTGQPSYCYSCYNKATGESGHNTATIVGQYTRTQQSSGDQAQLTANQDGPGDIS